MSDTVLPQITSADVVGKGGLSEDWLAALLGLLVVALALAGTVGPDWLG